MTSVSIGIAITFTFIHLADASIQSDFDLLTYSIYLITCYLMFYCVQLADRVSVYSVDIASVDALDYIDLFMKLVLYTTI